VKLQRYAEASFSIRVETGVMKSLLCLAAIPLIAFATPPATPRATVYFFVGTRCPIARQYAPRIQALGRVLEARGVRCVLVNANTDESAAEFSRWTKACGLTLPLQSDPGGALAKKLGASVTPEVAVLDQTGTVRYLGRIDDSPEPMSVTRRDALLAVESVLSGQPVQRPRLPAQGCRISAAPAPRVRKIASVSYHRDVRPILEKHCVGCHRPGEVAPFSLTSYAEAKAWATPIRRFTQNRQMPPWKAMPGHGDFFDARYLSQREMETLAAWDAQGAPEGPGAGKGRIPPLPPVKPWHLGTPDATLAPGRAFTVPAEGADIYRHFLLPIDTSQERHIAAFDFLPGNRRVVHHVILYCITNPESLGKEGADGQPGWPATGSPLGGDDALMVGGWAPGSDTRRLPPGVAFTLPKGAMLVAEVHYHPSGRKETDRTRIGVYFAPQKPRHTLQTYAVGESDFVLKPDLANQKVTAELEISEDITLWTLFPHMHQLGKTMRVWATLPDGTEKRLIKIDHWEFRWQGFYQYRQPVFLPGGTRVRLEAIYDNTKNNPDQPSLPPREVRYGEQTTDEMCFAFFNFSLGKVTR
jgi:peroxiredoxin